MLELMTVAEVSKVLKVNKNKVYELIRKRQLEALNLGSLKVPTFEVEAFIRRNVGKDLNDLEEIKDLVIE